MMRQSPPLRCHRSAVVDAPRDRPSASFTPNNGIVEILVRPRRRDYRMLPAAGLVTVPAQQPRQPTKSGQDRGEADDQRSRAESQDRHREPQHGRPRTHFLHELTFQESVFVGRRIGRGHAWPVFSACRRGSLREGALRNPEASPEARHRSIGGAAALRHDGNIVDAVATIRQTHIGVKSRYTEASTAHTDATLWTFEFELHVPACPANHRRRLLMAFPVMYIAYGRSVTDRRSEANGALPDGQPLNLPARRVDQRCLAIAPMTGRRSMRTRARSGLV